MGHCPSQLTTIWRSILEIFWASCDCCDCSSTETVTMNASKLDRPKIVIGIDFGTT